MQTENTMKTNELADDETSEQLHWQTLPLYEETFVVDKKRVALMPHDLVFQVYSRNKLSVSCSARLDVALGVMRKRGPKAGHELCICVDYSAIRWPLIARVCVARLNGEQAKHLKAVRYAGKVYHAAQTSDQQ